MSLIYITGPPGVGKTTIQKELESRGYEAYDIDQPRFGGPVNLNTGESTTVPPIDKRTPEWFEEHEWRVLRSAIEALKQEAIDRMIYLCGTATTENLVWDLFDKILYLQVDEATLRSRLADREGNDFGKTEAELHLILERYRTGQQRLRRPNVVSVDAASSLAATIQAIEQASH